LDISVELLQHDEEARAQSEPTMRNNNVETENLEERRRARRRLNAESNTDLWDEEFLYEERDLFNRSEVD
jgi:hypothetical protein